jgi:hypothetical protein
MVKIAGIVPYQARWRKHPGRNNYGKGGLISINSPSQSEVVREFKLNKVILGISAFYHDSAAAIVVNGNIIAAAQEERFTRKKHDPNFPEKAIRYCLHEAGVSLKSVDAIG